MISLQNTTLPGNNSDLHEAAHSPAPRMKWTCDAEGRWLLRPAREIDGDHPLTRIKEPAQ